jgi:zinc finger protein
MMYSVPFFNQLALFTIRCAKCNFVHNDVFSAEERKPSRWKYRVRNTDMLNTRVIRSGSGTVHLPDFGIDIEPGPAAESYISNVEGVLIRARTVVESAINFTEDEAEKATGNDILVKIDGALAGEYSFTIVVEDPMGVSAILPDDMTKVEYKELTLLEAARLRGAPLWLDTVRDEYRERKG